MQTPFFAVMLVLTASVLGAFGALMLKKSSNAISRNTMASLRNKALFIAVFLYGVSTIIFLFALKYGELSVLYPFAATTYVWVALLSIFFLKEKMNAFKWAGILAIIIGVVLIGLGG